MRAAAGHCLTLAIWILMALWMGLGMGTASADGPVRVGLYVQFEDGSTLTQCVELHSPEVTGLDVLRQSGLDFIFEAGGILGSAICKIGETGCDYPEESCFCQCLGKSCQYWTYWYAESGQWKYSPLGASNRTVTDGDVEGWVWGSGRESPPNEILTEDICPTPATATLIPPEMDTDSVPPLSRVPAAPTLAQIVSRVESETGSTSAQSQLPLPAEAEVSASLPPTPVGSSTGGGSPTYVWLIIGLSGVGTVLLGLVYFTTNRRM